MPPKPTNMQGGPVIAVNSMLQAGNILEAMSRDKNVEAAKFVTKVAKLLTCVRWSCIQL